MYDQVVKCQRAGLCLSEHFLISVCDHFACYHAVCHFLVKQTLGYIYKESSGIAKNLVVHGADTLSQVN